MAALMPFLDQDSSLISVFAESDALIRRKALAPNQKVGDLTEYIRLERF
jgi:molybdopterin molybdotransferase